MSRCTMPAPCAAESAEAMNAEVQTSRSSRALRSRGSRNFAGDVLGGDKRLSAFRADLMDGQMFDG